MDTNEFEFGVQTQIIEWDGFIASLDTDWALKSLFHKYNISCESEKVAYHTFPCVKSMYAN